MRFKLRHRRKSLAERVLPYSTAEFEALAVYNAERARGIVHTPEWQTRMGIVQARFDAQHPSGLTFAPDFPPEQKAEARRVFEEFQRPIGKPA